MRLVTTRRATGLTGLSVDQLREWSSRRALIPADVQNRGRGSPAQYSWQTILLLRIASTLRDRFHIELHAQRRLFGSLREALDRMSFLKLWGSRLAIYDSESWELIDADLERALQSEAIIIQLDPHLVILAAEFAMPSPIPTGQLELFPARLVAVESKETLAVARRPSRRQV